MFTSPRVPLKITSFFCLCECLFITLFITVNGRLQRDTFIAKTETFPLPTNFWTAFEYSSMLQATKKQKTKCFAEIGDNSVITIKISRGMHPLLTKYFQFGVLSTLSQYLVAFYTLCLSVQWSELKMPNIFNLMMYVYSIFIYKKIKKTLSLQNSIRYIFLK